ncbi:MAG: DsbA family protein [Ilumatobacteraceae bacterium]
MAEQQQRLVDAQREAQAVVDKAVAEARAEKAGVVAAATQEAAASLDQARKALTEERDRALGSLEGEVDRIAERIVGHVSRVAADDGLEFRMDIALRANTLLAHRALHWALEGSGPDAQTALKERLLRAYFTDGLDVGDPDVVARCATDTGLDGAALREWLDGDGGRDAVAADLRAAADREIDAVPSFVIDGRYLIPGAQDIEVFVNVIERVVSR